MKKRNSNFLLVRISMYLATCTDTIVDISGNAKVRINTNIFNNFTVQLLSITKGSIRSMKETRQSYKYLILQSSYVAGQIDLVGAISSFTFTLEGRGKNFIQETGT